MYAPNPQHLLHYKISTEPGGVRLRIWELATGPNTQAKAYLYIINHRLRSVAEAQASLRQHLDLTRDSSPGKNSVAAPSHLGWLKVLVSQPIKKRPIRTLMIANQGRQAYPPISRCRQMSDYPA